MSQQSEKSLYLYRKLLKLYPASYRQEYEEEMIDTMHVMLNNADVPLAKLNLLWLAFKDYVLTMTQQNILAMESATSETPSYIRQSSKFSTSLVLPFFIVCSYNWLSQYILHHQIAYAHLEAKTWVIYCIVLPGIAGLVIAFAGTRNLVENIKLRRGRVTEWLLLAVPLSMLITLVLL